MTEHAGCALAGFDEDFTVSLDVYIQYVQMYSWDVTFINLFHNQHIVIMFVLFVREGSILGGFTYIFLLFLI